MAEKISTLGYALLGLLGHESLSGYDLSRQLVGSKTGAVRRV